jgi:CheY-like chemotaxis protein
MTQMTQILHVDDMPDHRELVRAILEPAGYQVTSVESGEEAVRELARSDFAVILLDLQMPNGRGELVIQWILEHRPHLKPRILVTSGDTLSPGLDALMRKLEIQWLPKPYNIGHLRREVQRISAGGRQRE